MRRGRRKNQRCGAVEAIFSGAQNHGRDVLRLPGNHVEARDLPAINQIGMQRVGSDVTVFFSSHGMPIAKGDFAPIAAAGGSGGAALLLSAVNPVGKLIVGDDVIELRGRLVVPGTPRSASIDADRCALIAREQNDLRILGIDPDGVIVIAARRAASVERYVEVLQM